jgi:hypothetical protein
MESKADEPKAQIIKMEELVKGVPANKAPAAKAAQIAKQVLLALGKQLAAVEEGVVRVPGLGAFHIAKSEKSKDGKTTTKRRVVLRQSSGKAGGKKGGRTAGKAGTKATASSVVQKQEK